MTHQINFDVPSPETLAGIYVCIEGEEDLTVRPRQFQPIEIGVQQKNGDVSDDSRNSAATNEAR